VEDAGRGREEVVWGGAWEAADDELGGRGGDEGRWGGVVEERGGFAAKVVRGGRRLRGKAGRGCGKA